MSISNSLTLVYIFLAKNVGMTLACTLYIANWKLKKKCLSEATVINRDSIVVFVLFCVFVLFRFILLYFFKKKSLLFYFYLIFFFILSIYLFIHFFFIFFFILFFFFCNIHFTILWNAEKLNQHACASFRRYVNFNDTPTVLWFPV